jgi:hypothetical protein
MLHARNRTLSLLRMRSVGKRALDEIGKHPVNEDDEAPRVPVRCDAGSRVATGLEL